MLSLHKSTLVFSALVAVLVLVAGCGGGGGFAGSDSKKSTAKKDADGGDKEDDSADQPAEIAGAFLDDGTGETTKFGVVMKDASGRKVTTGADKLVVKFVPANGAAKVVATTPAPASSKYNVYASMPSADRKAGGKIQLRLVDGATKKSGKVDMAAMPTEPDDAEVFTNAAGDPTDKVAVSSGSASTSGSASEEDAPSSKSIRIQSKYVPLFQKIGGTDMSLKMFTSLLCDEQTGMPTHSLDKGFKDSFSTAVPDVGDVTFDPAKEGVCFERFVPLPKQTSYDNLGILITVLAIQGPKVFLNTPYPDGTTDAKTCQVVRGNRGGTAEYYVVNNDDPALIRQFVRYHHCKDDDLKDGAD